MLIIVVTIPAVREASLLTMFPVVATIIKIPTILVIPCILVIAGGPKVGCGVVASEGGSIVIVKIISSAWVGIIGVALRGSVSFTFVIIEFGGGGPEGVRGPTSLLFMFVKHVSICFGWTVEEGLLVLVFSGIFPYFLRLEISQNMIQLNKCKNNKCIDRHSQIVM